MPGRIIDVQSLRKRLRFHCVDDRLADTFEFIRSNPEVHPASTDTIDVETMRDRNGFYDFVGPHAGGPGTREHLLNRAHQLMRDVLIAEEPSAAILHAASIVVDGCRFIVLADKSTGKTTFCLKCIAEGFQVEGDEHVVVLDNSVMARARTLRVKQSSIGIVSCLDEMIRNAPSVQDWTGDRIYSVMPARAGKTWLIEQGPASYLVFLSANHGGATMVRPVSSDVAFERLLEMAFLPNQQRGLALARLHALTRHCQTVEMAMGDLDRATWHLRKLSENYMSLQR